MNVEVLFFGRLAEFSGTDKINFPLIKDTDELVSRLQNAYPLFINASYNIAVNNKLILQNTILSNGATVALLPPFSGG